MDRVEAEGGVATGRDRGRHCRRAGREAANARSRQFVGLSHQDPHGHGLDGRAHARGREGDRRRPARDRAHRPRDRRRGKGGSGHPLGVRRPRAGRPVPGHRAGPGRARPPKHRHGRFPVGGADGARRDDAGRKRRGARALRHHPALRPAVPRKRRQSRRHPRADAGGGAYPAGGARRHRLRRGPADDPLRERPPHRMGVRRHRRARPGRLRCRGARRDRRSG